MLVPYARGYIEEEALIRIKETRHREVLERQLSHYTVDLVTGCWLWLGPFDKDGYGKLKSQGKSVRAHRFFFEHYNNTALIFSDQWVLHDCPGGDNPACVNPSHLWLGDQQANEQDKDKKGRRVVPRKLTTEQVRDIKNSTVPGRVLCKLYELSPSAIWSVRSGRSWGSTVPEDALKPVFDTRHFGTDNRAAKLTEEEVLSIFGSATTISSLASEYRVCTKTIYSIKKQHTWKAVTDKAAAGVFLPFDNYPGVA